MTDRSVIFFDIDGTLLNYDKKLPQSTKHAIFKLKENGHKIMFATGRAPFMFEDLRQELDIHDFISYNGQYVVLNREVLYANSLNVQSLEKLTEAAWKNDHPVVFMDHEDMRANVPSHPYIKESLETFKSNLILKHDPSYYLGRELYQTLLFCPEGTEKQYEETFPSFDFVRWHPVSVDVIPKGGSKAKAIKLVTKKLNIPPEKQYAFGDGLNDMEMLQTVKNSIAMGNANETLKESAKYITKSVEDDGIYYGLQMVGLL